MGRRETEEAMSWDDDYRARRRALKAEQESRNPSLGKRRARARAQYARRRARQAAMEADFAEALRRRVRCDRSTTLPVGEALLRALDGVQPKPQLRLVSNRSE